MDAASSLATGLLRRSGDKCSKSCTDPPGELEANPDIGGIGVLVGFLGTAWLVVILVTIRYILAFDPRVDPFEDPSGPREHDDRWQPNPIDVRVLNLFSGLRHRFSNLLTWEKAITKILTAMCDIQLLTGIGILVSGYFGLICYISAYHWEILTYLAWFSHLTHAACLTALRGHLYRNQVERNWRMIFMAILLAGLITALVPTAYFNWATSYEGTASIPSSNARCFFSRSSAEEAWNQRVCNQGALCQNPTRHGKCNPPLDEFRCNDYQWIDATAAYESFIVSMILLSFTTLTRSVKLIRKLSFVVKQSIRRRLSRWFVGFLGKMTRRFRLSQPTSATGRLLSILRPLDLMAGVYLTAKLYLDVFSSELSDLYWLLLSSLWTTIRLFQSRPFGKIEDEENEWGFGQILPVFLLLGPIVTVFITLQAEKNSERGQNASDTTPQGLDTLRSDQNDMRATQNGCSNSFQPPPTARQEYIELRNNIPRSQSFSQIDVEQSDMESAVQTSETEVLAADCSSVTEAGKQVLPLLNQDMIMATENLDIAASFHSYFIKSRWICLTIWLLCVQIISATLLTLLYILGPGNSKPSGTVTSLSIHVLGTQPINCFAAMIVGLYIDDERVSKRQLFLFSFVIWGLLVYNFLSLFGYVIDVTFLVSWIAVIFLLVFRLFPLFYWGLTRGFQLMAERLPH